LKFPGGVVPFFRRNDCRSYEVLESKQVETAKEIVATPPLTILINSFQPL
jgi:hypothetical protein